ncbi:MAG: Tex family protein [Corynebacterium sp.]|nr:Tex family protein [Corynebacterium sp.]
MIAATIAQELGIRPDQVRAALDLFEAGNTVPFVARYRKEATGGLDDTQLRTIEERATYLRELQERKEMVLAAIEEQGKLTDDLRELISACTTKARLEDLYRPFKKRRTTKADAARAAGIAPLIDEILANPAQDPAQLAAAYTTTGYEDTAAVLAGAKAIVVDTCALDAEVVAQVRTKMYDEGALVASVIPGQEAAGEKYQDYFDFQEPFESLPSHRILALLRAEQEGIVRLHCEAGEDNDYEKLIAAQVYPENQSPWITDAIHWAWRTKLSVSGFVDVRMRLKEFAEQQALHVFAKNLRDVLLAAPAGQRATLGLDPGYRNGVKCAVVDATGKVEATTIIYPHPPQNRWQQAVTEVANLCAQYGVELLAIGNGTASRETEKMAQEVADLLVQAGGKRPIPVVVSESGASVYSASATAAAEFPDMDVSLRGAVSIARRLQDPLAELVKIDPKAIGVGQYQHDVNQIALAHTLDAVVEDAVNAVGVDLNSASIPLLSRVAGISPTLAENIVAYRDANGAFHNRKQLHKVTRLGPKAFEQCAGFLRIRHGDNPLDASAVHPETYDLVHHIASATGNEVASLIGNKPLLAKISPMDFATDQFGIPTITDVLSELEKPGRDPRPEFRTASFREDIASVGDLRPGMYLEGTVTNVAAFGAFVDIGVHQDGLVHISQLADQFVADPHAVVHSGQVVRVRVMDVDVERKRISLSMRQEDAGAGSAKTGKKAHAETSGHSGTSGKQMKRGGRTRGHQGSQQRSQASARGNKKNGHSRVGTQGSMADALRKAGF